MRLVRSMSFLTLSIAMLLAFTVTAGIPAAQAGDAEPVPNKCLAGKTKCVSKKLKGLLKCREKCQKNPKKCGPKQTDCEAKVRFKFERPDNPAKGCFAKLEAKEKESKPESICTTIGDTATIEAQVDTLVGDIVATLEDPTPCENGVKTPLEVVHDHQAALAAEDAAALACTYHTNAVRINDAGVCTGPSDISASLLAFVAFFGGPPVIVQETAVGDTVRVLFTIENMTVAIDDGVETYHVENGRIRTHTTHGTFGTP